MGFLDELKKLTRPYNDDDDDYGYDEYDRRSTEEEPEDNGGKEPRDSFYGSADMDPAYTAPAAATPQDGGRMVNMGSSAAQLQVVLVMPDRFENVRDVAENLRCRKAVLLNLEKTEYPVARRIVDFMSGCAFALDGKLKKVASNTYLLTPFNVDIVGDLVEEIENNGNYL